MKKITYQNVTELLVEEIPEFKSIYDEYQKNQDGENLPHVLFEDFARFIIKQYCD